MANVINKCKTISCFISMNKIILSHTVYFVFCLDTFRYQQYLHGMKLVCLDKLYNNII